MELARIPLHGRPLRAMATEGSAAEAAGVVGIEIAERVVDEATHTVVQIVFDDDRPGFDCALLDAPLLAELVGADGTVLGREPFDHDRFRRQLHAERQAGNSITRGVLVLTDGQLPPPWVRLAFVRVSLPGTPPDTRPDTPPDTPPGAPAAAAAVLVVRRTTADDLRLGVEQAYALGQIGDDERRAVLTSIDQRHPT